MHRTLIAAISVALFLVMLCALPLPAAAGPSDQEAAAEFKAGQKLYKKKKFSEALPKFARANELGPHPYLLLMMARCHHGMNHYSEAIAGFKAYLEARPDAPERKGVEKLIADLTFMAESDAQFREEAGAAGEKKPEAKEDGSEGSSDGAAGAADAETEADSAAAEPDPDSVAVARPDEEPGSGDGAAAARPAPSAAAAPAVPRAPTPAPEDPPVYKRWWFWTIIGVGVAAAGGVGGYFIARETASVEYPPGDLGTLDLR